MSNKSHFDHLVSTLQSKYGGELGLFLAKRIAVHLRDKECVDNFRIADRANPEEVAQYEDAKRFCGVDLLCIGVLTPTSN